MSAGGAAPSKKNKNRSSAAGEDNSGKLLVIEPLSQPEQWEKDPAYARYSQLKAHKHFREPQASKPAEPPALEAPVPKLSDENSKKVQRTVPANNI